MSTVFSSALLLVVPLLFAALGGLVHRASGVVNIGLEGQMLAGALVGVLVSGHTGSWVLGILGAVLAGGITGLLMTLVITRLRANAIIVGLGVNILVAGVIGFVLKWELGVAGTLRIDGLDRVPRWHIDALDGVPVLREIVNDKDVLFLLALVLIPATAWMLRNTAFGLRLRAAGDAETAAESLGLNVLRKREYAGLIAGVLAGLGGGYLSLAQVGLFNSQMIAGRGFIALAAFYFGRNRPVPTAIACLIFAFFDAWQGSLQTGTSIGQLLTTLPYLIVVVALASSAAQQRARARKLPSS
ncbi:ABC transporter permease [Amycolatopsis taiwanensis]|uniref:ABC transporter permease n=1 Tax=Amycolatopsis taiwanensis TaxID=342230 RepID=A0A9W6VE38_9PSEU|nr:ABC transporter permease [Amycolatopsis taiwanensis]GLY68033.1 ABC transporter permease [Amycolatopsis taiwanensis]